jgi:hypothetical protein
MWHDLFGLTREQSAKSSPQYVIRAAQRLRIDAAAREKVVSSGSMRRHINPS